MDLLLDLFPHLPTPLFQQIVDQLEALILSGDLKEGEALPSVRDFAVRHTLNPNTVSRAYQQLQSMGLVDSVRGIGLRVAATVPADVAQRRDQLLRDEVDAIVTFSKSLGVSRADLVRKIQERWEQ